MEGFRDSKVRENIAKKYVPLLHKIANQLMCKTPPEMTYNDLLGYGEEGIVYAMNTFKDGMGQTFQQYLAWCIRNKMFTGINEEGHTIKFSAYSQKKAKEGNGEYISVTSISSIGGNSEDGEDSISDDHIAQLGVEQQEPNPPEVWKQICEWAKSNFSERDADMFIRFYGLDGEEPMEGKELAVKYGVSNCCVTISKKKIIEAIKKSNELKDLLIDLL